ncbi:single-stranded DNA-binding protein [bacterium]|nr:single-stranded DNA-binding protein [bacterium]
MMNRIILIGRLTRDPELRYTQSGIPVANFSVAVDRRFKNASGERETDFINIVAWRKQAELVGEYLNKGFQVAVEGSLQMRKYQTREGENRTAYEVVADSVQFLDRGGRRGQDSGGSSTYKDADAPPDNYDVPDNAPSDDSDLPF